LRTDTSVSAADIAARCANFISQQLNVPADRIDPDMEFEDFGMDSALVTSMLMELEEWLEMELSPSLVFEEPTLDRLSRKIAGQLEGGSP
jgi:acyl carrier protein